MDVELKNVMLTNERLEYLIYKKIIIKEQKKDECVKDLLFWIFYKLYDVNYEKYPNFEDESKIKLNLLSNFDKKKEIYKQHKLKKEDIENDLIYNKVISITGFTALCLHYNINIIINNKRSYYVIGFFDCEEKKVPVLVYNQTFSIMYNNLKYFKNYYKLPSVHKSIDVVSKYKLNELKEIANTNNILIEGKKIDIYNKLKIQIISLINL